MMGGRGGKAFGMSGAAVAAALFAAGCAGPAATGATTAAASGSPASSAPARPAAPAPAATAAGTAPASPAPGASAAGTSGTPSPTPSATTQSCASYAASHTFAQVTGAKLNSDGSLTVTAHRATVVCGGPDDMHYNVAAAAETATVTPPGTVRMLTGVVKEQTVAHADVSARLAQDNWGRIFMVNGPLTAVTALTEMYHP